jgi:uncharacterized membrane protein YcjF (UPF0283 family)
MNIWTSLFLVYILFIILSYIKLAFSKEARDEHKTKQSRLEELRKIAYKTQAEQKEFLDLKYPRTEPFKWSFKKVGMFILRLFLFAIVFINAKSFWDIYIRYDFAIWQVVILMVIIPIGLNMIMKRFGLHKDDIRVYFK